MSFEKLDDVSSLLKAHYDEEARAEFPRFRRTPSSGAIQFLDYFDSLSSAGRGSLLSAIAEVAAKNFFPALAVDKPHESSSRQLP